MEGILSSENSGLGGSTDKAGGRASVILAGDICQSKQIQELLFSLLTFWDCVVLLP